MDAKAAEIIIKACLQQIQVQLEQATGIATAAQACADTGNVKKAIEIALDIEQPIYEAGALLNAASLLNRAD